MAFFMLKGGQACEAWVIPWSTLNAKKGPRLVVHRLPKKTAKIENTASRMALYRFRGRWLKKGPITGFISNHRTGIGRKGKKQSITKSLA